LLESKSIDIPTTTSAALLRQYSHHGPAGKDPTDDETENPLGRLLSAFGKAGATPSGEALLELRGPLAELANKARPDQRAVLEELSRRLELGDQATVEDVQRRIKQMEGKAAAAGAKAATAAQAYAKTRERLQEQVRELWPELAADFSPTAMALTSERADDFVAGVTGLAAYEALCQAREREEQAADEQHEVSCAGARLERLLRSCEDIVLAANLRRVAPQEIVARYEQLLLLECGTLGTAEKSADGPASARPETIDD
jgi:hypothetical protein